jgi:hypothetical protein
MVSLSLCVVNWHQSLLQMGGAGSDRVADEDDR